ncbi:sigma-70 family RNA polymerase sigma factor [Phyllobacterium myrsinacearum]|uniref:RNA polymerase subunit sigma-70 n=1 Tax=Phyllobacterium myrsinacearum TaxID=28101 RepID=A0A2S9JH15_9HYPH|nr:sigma-70 family RNA polymerase sigma factor [Phyllobacterium myrsinacearum]PRD52273.1 RNA polymerase subunit sigma-70 [Phyllobacterium myrsinacearum]PWV92373.1 RNA polymerase ECF family sigma subunit [Phyllobacterium myrsinacearum]RZV04819.1 RNA polymerase ECF family sigma subunit [Phyllobacterium myrsinacearum]
MNTGEFEDRLNTLRPRLHRYCARMTGSSVDGEDVLQDTLIKALRAHAEGTIVENLEAWLLRIAHNASLDFLRRRSRSNVVPLTDDLEAAAMPETDIVAVGFQTFLQLPELQRCAVILKDVLGHSVEEIAAIAGSTPAAAKSALQRGRTALRQLAQAPEDTRLPLMSDADRRKMTAYVHLFRSGDFDAIRAMLADDVRLDLVNRLQWKGRDKIGLYFTRYAEETKWRFVFGAVEGQPAMLVFDGTGPMDRPAHFVLIGWSDSRIMEIRDFLFAPYVLEGINWVRLG